MFKGGVEQEQRRLKVQERKKKKRNHLNWSGSKKDQ